LDDIDLPIDESDDGDEQLDGVSESGVEETSPCFSNAERELFGAVKSARAQ
jgi:hypothetical protein